MKIYSTIAALLISTSALAEPVDFTSQLLGTDGKPIPECITLNPDRTKCTEETSLTLGWFVRFALDMPEEKMPLSEIIKRGTLSQKIKGNDKLDLSVDEAKLIKDQIVKLNYKVFVKYQALKLIDPKGVEDAK